MDRFKNAGGDRGWIDPTKERVAYRQLLIDAEAGDVLGPIEDGDQFIVLRVNASQEQGDFTLEESASKIRSALTSQNFAIKLDEHIRLLRQNSEIVIDEELLESLKITADPLESAGAAHQDGRGTHQ